ncbi:MAG: hypothetical protein IJ535_04785 [Pseudobutyrivibrio sp.]|uniref:hypothetical protein n=1 Tax=Pseudobutyrivibrio sp. TaxID=2014367 RepID=UPI0025F11B4E|nr:hypothetical protein [Pseudobutyrivibrio sp.]MBQ8489081.1 hypothetical protein [Pseudobutyrivibrio sp.]
MKKLVVILLIGLLGIGGAIYGKRAYNDYQKEAQFQDAIARTVDADEIEASKDAVDLSWDECKEFTELLDSDEYNGFYRVTFDNPKDIDWNEVLADGAGIPREKITKEDKKFYLDDRSYNSLDCELLAISGASIKDYIYKHTGTSIDLKDDLLWVYNKNKDVYYKELDYLQYKPCTCVSGVKLKDTYVLEVASDKRNITEPNKKMVLVKIENGYVVKLSVNMWEVGNDKKLTFDVDIPQLSSDARLVTYQSDDAHFDDGNSARIAIIGDNQLVDFVNLYASDDDIIDIRKITHIEVCDLNCDGVNDLIAIGYDNHSILKTIIFTTEKKYDDTYGLFTASDLSFSLSNELADNLTIDGIKEAILGTERKANHNWQEAYKQFIKVEGSDYYADEKYSLAYINGDDVPELIKDKIESISIYNFKDGLVTPIAIDLDYYITGEEPYQYSPHNNWIKLHDEEIGSDYYTNQIQYYFIKDNELEMRYCLSYDYDNTADEDNEAEENSLIATVKPTDYTKNIPDEEVISLIEDIEENKFIDLVGKYTADELIKIISDKY